MARIDLGQREMARQALVAARERDGAERYPHIDQGMAELIDACEKGLDHDKEPFQYKMKYTGRMTDVGFFSRKREINYNSSFSVNG